MSGLTVRARTPDGFAVEHAVLTVTDLTGQQLARSEGDAAGQVGTEPLPPGVHTAVLTAAGFLPAARTAQVGSDGAGSLGEITLEPEEAAVPLPAPGPWVIDPAHSSVVATAQHLGIASIKGRFSELAGRITVERPVERSMVRAEIKAASIDTGINMRDDHLRSAEFLDTEAHPLIEFVSTGLRRRGTDDWTLSGTLMLHGTVRNIDLDLRYGGSSPDPWGGERAAFHAETLLRRDDFAISYNAMVRAGIAAVGTTVRVELDIQAVRGDSLPTL